MVRSPTGRCQHVGDPMTERTCAWCRGAIATTARLDAVTCSKRCRQARHRFAVGVGTAASAGAGRRMRFAYADPPYPGMSHRYYRDHPDYAGEVDHDALIRQLSSFDGWALSTSAAALPAILAMCPPGVRVAAWHRGERPTLSGRPLNAWEPVIYWGGRVGYSAADAELYRGRTSPASATGERVAVVRGRRLDSLVHHSRPRLTDPDRVIGAKPAVFIRWMFELLGAERGDEFVDIFSGSGGVARAWEVFTAAATDADAQMEPPAAASGPGNE